MAHVTTSIRVYVESGIYGTKKKAGWFIQNNIQYTYTLVLSPSKSTTQALIVPRDVTLVDERIVYFFHVQTGLDM